MKRKEIYLLIGKKGSGKSFIGTIFNKEFGIKFIRVEDWVKNIKKDRAVDNDKYVKQSFNEIEKGIIKCLYEMDKLVFESTGLSEYFDQMLLNLNEKFNVITIGVNAKNETCLERVKTRNQEIHINISDEQVTMINQKVIEKKMETDFHIDNENKTEKDLIIELMDIIRLTKKSINSKSPNR